MNIKNIAVKDLIPYSKNTKKHDDTQIANVAESIKQYGFVQPLVVDKNNVVVIGHCRLLAAKKLKMADVPCVCVDDLTPEQVNALRIVDNKSNESEWDLDLLADELLDIDLSGFDFDFGVDTYAEEETEIVEDETPEVDEENEPITKLGDIWQLGRHRLVCGDSTDKATVEKLMNGAKADMVFTDPPYGMLKLADGVLNDQLDSVHQRSKNNLLDFNKKWIPLTFENLKDNGSWYCWGIDTPLMDIFAFILKPMIEDVKITFRNLITWDKGVGQGQNSELFRKYPVASEKCLFCQCGYQEGFNNNGDDFDMRFEPIREYIEQECEKCGINEATKFNEVLSATNKYQHLVTRSHWYLVKEKDYIKLKDYAKSIGVKAFEKPYSELEKEYNSLWAYFDNTHDNMNDVWHFDRTSASERELTGGHATPKPIALCSRAIKTSSRENEIVLDVFGGSGSTLIACEQTNRICYMLELSEKYCDVIIKRWETLTGEKAVKLN